MDHVVKPYPRNVQAQLDQANEIERQLATANSPSPQEPEVAVAEVPPVVVTPEAPVDVPRAEPWEQRYRSLQGQFNALVPQLQGEVKTLRSELQAAIDTLKAQAKPAEQPAPKVTDKDVEVFGSDLIELQRRIAHEATESARSAYQPVIDALTAQVNEMRASLGEVNVSVAASETDRYYYALGQLVPDWDTVNTNPQFLAWLAETDPLSGNPRQAALDNAFSAQDAQRTAAVFNVWKHGRTPAVPTPPAPSAQEELARQVAPSRSHTPQQTQAPQGRSFSGNDIAAFYDNKRRNRYDPETARNLENEINDAIAHGRVTP